MEGAGASWRHLLIANLALNTKSTHAINPEGTALNWTYLSIIVATFGLLGVVSALQAIMTTRTSQGAIAWAISLLTWPIVAVPLYWTLGRSRFRGQVRFRRGGNATLDAFLNDILRKIEPHTSKREIADRKLLHSLAHYQVLGGNDTHLYIDGPEIFKAIFAAIDEAKEYVLAEFYIVHDDELGRVFLSHLTAASERGCQVYLLYDEMGSRQMTKSFRSDLEAAGGQISPMNTTKGFGNRFQVNFRNHRKIVVVDGKVAFVGGANVGDEYVHRDKRLTPWRDTFIGIEGPAVLGAQYTFVEDWHWATGQLPSLQWEPVVAGNGADKSVIVLPSGPDDRYETCGLCFAHAINRATRRLWIASPYFVPDEGVTSALQLAAMRGVEVRILIPGLPDKWLVKQAAYSYIPELSEAGVQFYEYAPGFLHQKVLLVDDDAASIGTANFDNRSFRLNFEVSAITYDHEFASKVEAMLQADFDRSSRINPGTHARRSYALRVTSKIARLLAPIL